MSTCAGAKVTLEDLKEVKGGGDDEDGGGGGGDDDEELIE